MDTLFPDSEVFQKERPTKLTEQQETDLYLKLANEVISGKWSTNDAEDIAEDLKSLSNLNHNGYELAKELEDSYNASYDIDTDFCEWLDCISAEHSQVLESNVKQWVKAHEIMPKFEKSAKLKVKDEFKNKFENRSEIVIGDIDFETAKYKISFDDPNIRYYYTYELVEECCEPITQ